MKIFGSYSKYYDVIYKNKDYTNEVDFVLNSLKKFSPLKDKNLLSIGCGTCNYEILLAKKGFQVTGVDSSNQMLTIAKTKIKKQKLSSKINLFQQDAKHLNLPNKFNNAIAMFNVISYMSKNSDINSFLKSVRNTIQPQGIFAFDCWYMPAVLKDKPTDRIKIEKIGSSQIMRLTKSILDINQNTISINFKLYNIQGRQIKDIVEETHLTRYWSLPELEMLLSQNGFKILHYCNFLDFKSHISENNWNIFIVAQAQ